MANPLDKLRRRRSPGWPRQFPVVQPPNAPVLAAQGLAAVGALAGDPVGRYARAASLVALTVWGWQEVTDGANWVRRAMGAAGLVLVAVRAGGRRGGP